MNRDSWDRLPKDIQEMLDEIGNFAPEMAGTMGDQLAADGEKLIRDKGGEIIELSPEEAAWFTRIAVDTINPSWVAAMEAKGLSGKDILEKKYDFVRKYGVDF